MNETTRGNGLVLYRLIFEIVSIFPILGTDLPKQKERMEAIEEAQVGISFIVAVRHVQKPLSKNIPSASDHNYKLGEALVYSEQRKLWDGPFIMIHAEGEIITVQNNEMTMRITFRSFQVKPFYP